MPIMLTQPASHARARMTSPAARARGVVVAAAAALALAAPAAAQDSAVQPGVVYAQGSKFDKSFNEGVFNGASRFAEEAGVELMEREIDNPAGYERAQRALARRGATSIITVGFQQADALSTVAPDFPEVRFTIIDSVVEADNVRSVVFKEQQGAFLVGLLAAMHSETGEVAFVGGMDIPLIRAVSCGFRYGAQYAGEHHVDQDITVHRRLIGTTPAAWNNPGRGAELAQSLFDQGVDVVFHGAGASGLGVIQAAEDAGRYAIGVDSNQNYIAPGTVLTSMLKRVDRVAYRTLKAAQEGSWEPGVDRLGLAEGALGWSIDEHNRHLITPEMEQAANAAEQMIIDGEITVHDYRSDGTCPYSEG